MYDNEDDGQTGRYRGPMTIYDELGGDRALALVVSEFYERVSSDEITAFWFRNVANPETFKSHLGAYLAVVLDGPERYVGRSMRHAHAGLDITPAAFDSMLARLAESFNFAGMEPELVAKVHSRLQRLQAAIVHSPPLTGSHDVRTTRHL
jgi:hemoglobin